MIILGSVESALIELSSLGVTAEALRAIITGSTVVLTCCKGDGQSQWKTPIFAPHSSETP